MAAPRSAATARRLRDLGHGWWEWLQESQVRQQRHAVAWGFVFGLLYGVFLKRYQRYRGVFGDHVVITEFEVAWDEAPRFEVLWNGQARLAQKFEGYLGTRLYKAMNRDWPEERAKRGAAAATAAASPETLKLVASSPATATGAPADALVSGHELRPAAFTDTLAEPLPDHQLSPYQYIQLRMWRSPLHEQAWLDDAGAQNLRRQISGACKSIVSREYGTLVNDAVCRAVL